MTASLGSTTYTTVTWTTGDVVTEAKLDNMVANDQAYDSHSAEGYLADNNKSFAGKNNAGSSNLNLMKLDASDDLVLGDTGVGLSATNLVADEDDMTSDSVDKLATQQSIKAYVDSKTPTLNTCSVHDASSKTIATSTWTAVDFDSEYWDNNSMHDTVTNNSRITIPTGGSGYYLVTGKVSWTSNATGARLATLYINGSSPSAKYFKLENCNIREGYGGSVYITFSTILDLNAGWYFDLRVWQNTGSDLDIQAETYLSVHQLSYK